MGPDPFGTVTKLVWVSLVFKRDLVDPVWICYLVPNGSTYEGDPVPVSNRSRVNRVDPYHTGSDPIRI